MLSQFRGALLFSCVALAACALLAPPAQAKEVFGKWRVELKIGGISPGDEIRSDAANRMTIEDETGRFTISDPRPDAASQLEGRLATDPRIDLRLSYGVKSFRNSELVFDVGVGHWTSRINNLELAYSLDGEDGDFFPLPDRVYNGGTCVSEEYVTGSTGEDCLLFTSDGASEEWHWRSINAGELTQVPVSLNAYMRFRPTKKFNPYIGGGVGWLFVDFKPSADWLEFSDQMDASIVDSTVYNGLPSRLTIARELAGNPRDLKRPAVVADDGFFFELRGGFEWQWKPKLAVFVETSFMWAAEEIVITVDGKEKFGKATPAISVKDRSDETVPRGGLPEYIICGGLTGTLIDPDINISSNAFCPGAGEYYFNGGRLDHGGFSFQAGIRLTL